MPCIVESIGSGNASLAQAQLEAAESLAFHSAGQPAARKY